MDGMGAVHRARYTARCTARSRLVHHCGCQLDEGCELRSCPELRDWVELLESARERVGQAPHCSRGELFDLRIEVLTLNAPGQVSRGVELALHECPVDNQVRYIV